MSEQPQPTAFFSYARWDDEHDSGYLSQFRKRLAEEVQAHTGNEFLIFQDQIDVAWGQDWQQRITDSLNETVFFIPVLTPTFFTRDACRQETTSFLEREKAQGHGGLILPVYYISSPLLDDAAARATDPLAQALQARQRADWRKLRLVPFKERKAQAALVSLAVQLSEALRQSRTPGPVPPGPVKITAPDKPAQRAETPPDTINKPDTVQQSRPATPATGKADSLINMGIAIGQMGDMTGAAERFRQAVAAAPGNADVLIGIGLALADMGDLNGAFNQLHQAISSNSAAAYNGLGVVLGRTGDLNGAAAQFRQAISADPAFGRAYINLGMALGQMGDLNGAFDQFRRAAALTPGDADSIINIGVALGQMGDRNGAFARFNQAVALDPYSAKTHNSLGIVLWRLAGDLNGAAGQFRQAMALSPSFSEAWNNLGILLKQVGDLNGAFGQFRQVLTIETANQVS